MLTTMEKILFLQRVPMFEGLSSRNLRVISDIADEEQFPAAQLVFEEGQPGDRMFIIVEGQVQIEKDLGNGRQAVLANLEKRDMLGDMAILDDEPRSATARTLSDSRLLAVGSASIKDLIREYPDIAFGLLRFCAQRIRESNRRLQAMSTPAAATETAAPTEPRLVVVRGPDEGKIFTISQDLVKLGRAGGEEMEALDRFAVRDGAKQVSRNHAEVYRQDGRFFVRDCGSVNGTFVNDRRVTAPTPLAAGDRVRLGSEATLRFES